MITSKQRSYLRSLAHNIDPLVYIGKQGITENVIKELDNCLENRELVKVKIQEGCELEPKQTAKPFKCSVCGNDVVPVSFDGKNYSARAIAEQTTKKKGQCMCWDCYMKAVQA